MKITELLPLKVHLITLKHCMGESAMKMLNLNEHFKFHVGRNKYVNTPLQK